MLNSKEAINWKGFYDLELKFCTKLLELDYKKYAKTLEYIYNPLEYASEVHCVFLKRFFKVPIKLLFVGMNPGPFGMAQTGVPFGDVRSVSNWMNINGSVKVPTKYHPKKPVHGLKCTRNEVSGERFWGFFSQKLNISPETFFNNAFVINICPLLFLDKNGKNVALSTLPAELRKKVENLCSEFLLETIDLLHPKHIIAVGQYAYEKINKLLQEDTFLTSTQQFETSAGKDGIILLENISTIATTASTTCNTITTTLPTSSPPPKTTTSSLTQLPTTTPSPPSPTSSQPPTTTTTTTLPTLSSPSPPTPTTTPHKPRTTPVGLLMHPSPANPLANKGWDNVAWSQLTEMGVMKYFTD